LVCVDRNELDSNNHIEVIMVVIFKGGGLTKEELSKKLCFGVNGVNVFIGSGT
jgi:transcription initiation factor IIE alpha subunit